MKKRFVEIDEGLDFSIKHIESGEIFYDCESVVDILNELSEENQSLKFQLNECQNHKLFSRRELEKENEQLKQAIAETEKMVQSTYDELTKLRCIKKNLRRIKSQWDWIMGAVQYD